MKIYILIEDSKPKGSAFIAESGLCLYFVYQGKRILFDTGASDAFIYNATLLGIDLLKVDMCILSHAHEGHTGGLAYFLGINKDAPVYMKSAARGEFCGDALDFPAVFQIVACGLAMRGEQLDDGPGEDLPDHVGDMGAAAMAGRQQPARLERLQRVAQDRPRHVELARQFPLAGQPVAGAQYAFEDERLDLLHDLVGGARMLDPGEDFAQGRGPGWKLPHL